MWESALLQLITLFPSLKCCGPGAGDNELLGCSEDLEVVAVLFHMCNFEVGPKSCFWLAFLHIEALALRC